MSVEIGIVTVSDRASQGIYPDLSGPAIQAWLSETLTSPWTPVPRVIPDGRDSVRACLLDLCARGCGLILVTGGTGPAPRDQTPEALDDLLDKELPGFGEVMRRVSFETVPTAILSRQTAGIRGQSLIVLLPGKPAAIRVCLDAIFAAVPYCLDLIGAGRLETNPERINAFRPA